MIYLLLNLIYLIFYGNNLLVTRFFKDLNTPAADNLLSKVNIILLSFWLIVIFVYLKWLIAALNFFKRKRCFWWGKISPWIKEGIIFGNQFLIRNKCT